MFEELGLGNWTPRAASIALGLLLGMAFGILAQRSHFCLRRGLVGNVEDRNAALGTWFFGLATAIAGTTLLVLAGIVDFSGHRFFAENLPVAAIVMGGLTFGAGMFLARGCASRLTVLVGSGNLRALVALIFFAVTAHATLKGVLAPARVWLASLEFSLGQVVSLAEMPGGILLWSLFAIVGLVWFAIRSGARKAELLMGGLIGLLVPLGWLGTGYLLVDEFNPIKQESIAFTSAASESLFWWIAGTAIAPGFGVGLLGGVVLGSFASSIIAREFNWIGFEERASTGRYLVGGALMGVGGVLAGGCTIGAGLTGAATLSISALLALVAIIAGVFLTQVFFTRLHDEAIFLPAE